MTRPHNPTGALMDVEALQAVGGLAAARGAHVLVDEVYLDATDEHAMASYTGAYNAATTVALEALA